MSPATAHRTLVCSALGLVLVACMYVLLQLAMFDGPVYGGIYYALLVAGFSGSLLAMLDAEGTNKPAGIVLSVLYTAIVLWHLIT